MLTKFVNGQRVRKSSLSGAGNDCIYPTSPASTAPFVHDSKAEENLTVTASQRNHLIRFAAALGAAGVLALGILVATDVPVGGGSVQADPAPMTHNAVAGCLSYDGICRSILGADEKDW